MPATWILYRSIWALNLVATALVIWRLYSIGLAKTYRFFLASMALGLVRSAALFPFSFHDAVYYQVWALTQPVVWLSFILVVSELYSLVLKQYRGIFTVGRIFFFGGVAISALLSALTVLPTVGPAAPFSDYPVIYYYSLIERGIVTSLAIFLLLLLLLVVWFPVPMSRNLLTHCVVYSAYFFANNVLALYRQMGGRSAAYAGNLARLTVGLACLMCWFLYLSRQGEERMTSLRLKRNPLKEKHLLGQLENLNATLLGTARK
jgi:hypothetical protein